jgi:O-antigen/teichoic acid export membrane protein
MKRSFLKDAFDVLFSNSTALVISVITSVIVNRALGPDLKGILVSLIVYPSLIQTLCEAGIRQSTVQVLGHRKYTDEKIIGSVSTLFWVTSILSVILCAVIYCSIKNPNFTHSMIALALISMPLGLVRSYSTGVLLGREKIKEYNRTRWIPAVMILLGSCIFVWMLQFGVNGAQIAGIMGLLPVVIYALFLVNRIAPLRPQWNTHLFRSLLKMGGLYALALFTIQLNYRISVVMLERLAAPGEIGQFSIGLNFAEVIWQIPTALGVVVFSRSANAKQGKEFSFKVVKLLRVAMVSCLLVVLVVGVGARYIIPLLYGDAFRASEHVLQYMLPGILIMVLFKVLNMDLAGKGRPLIAFYSCLPGLIINFILCHIMIPKYGAIGAAWASSASFCVFALVFFIVYMRFVGIPVREIVHFQAADFDFIQTILTRFRVGKKIEKGKIL